MFAGRLTGFVLSVVTRRSRYRVVTRKGLELGRWNWIVTAKQTGGRMNKSQLIERMAEAGDISKSAATRALDALTDSIAEGLKNGETISLIGFGTFSVRERAARTGRNPQTGATIDIAASKTPTFKAGKALKDAVK
ncbi:HU family DNA-binding protein [Thioflavicoccus mobilis]|nr:HU family DNA-binding protein [Thioflavicoccus mobilis]